MSYLRYLRLFAHIGVQHILCCVFILSCVTYVAISLDYPFLIASSVFYSDFTSSVIHDPNTV